MPELTMAYLVAQPYKCGKCGHEFKFSPDDGHPAPVLSQDYETDRGTVLRYLPVCPQCWTKFLMENIGLGFCTVKWLPEGSDYEVAMKGKQ